LSIGGEGVGGWAGCLILGSVKVVWLTTGNNSTSLHCAVISVYIMSDHTGHLWSLVDIQWH